MRMMRDRSTTSTLVLLTSLVLALSLSVPALCQQDPTLARGFDPNQSYQIGDVDHVNNFNGNLALTIPVGGSYPVGGRLSYQLILTYNGNLWDAQRGDCDLEGCEWFSKPSPAFNAGPGWTLSLGQLLAPSTQINDTPNWVYVSADGARHSFFDELHPSMPSSRQDNADDFPNLESYYTRDASYIRMLFDSTLEQRKVEMPNGTFMVFTESSDGDEWLLREMSDSFENSVAVDYLPNDAAWDRWEIADQHSNPGDATPRDVHEVVFRDTGLSSYPKVVSQVNLAAFGALTATYDFDHTNVTMARGCPHNDDSNADIVVPLLTKVSLPDGSSWDMPASDYAIGTGICSVFAGRIRGLTLPTGGKIEWEYGSYRYPLEDSGFPPPPPALPNQPYQIISGVTKRTTIDRNGSTLGVWEYSSELTPVPGEPFRENELVNTTVDPLGHVTKRYFSVDRDGLSNDSGSPDWTVWEYGLPFTRNASVPRLGPHQERGPLWLSTQVFDKDDLEDPIRETYLSYRYDRSAAPTPDGAQNTNRRIEQSRVVYKDDEGSYVHTLSQTNDGFGLYETTVVSGTLEDSGDDQTRFRITNRRGKYDEPDNDQDDFVMPLVENPWVRDTPVEELITNSFVNDQVQTKFCKELPHPSFPTRRRMFYNPAGGSDGRDRLAVWTPDEDGNLAVEENYGGHNERILEGVQVCTLALPNDPEYKLVHNYEFGTLQRSSYHDPITDDVFFTFIDRAIDANTGLVASAREVNGIDTTFQYDALGRVTRITPEQGAWTSIDYRPALNGDAAGVRVRQFENGNQSGAPLTDEFVEFDGFGRVSREFRRQPGASSDGDPNPGPIVVNRETRYNGRGERLRVSEWRVGSQNHVTRFDGYDPFGRPTTITRPDGNVETFSYLGDREVQRTVTVVTAAGAQSSTTIETYDNLGQLNSVTEPSGPGGSMTTTRYKRHASGAIREVSTDGQSQTRVFEYHGLGLDKTKLPEDDRSEVHWDYADSRGNLLILRGLLTDPNGPDDWGAGVEHRYDKAERLVEVWEAEDTNHTPRILKRFTYGDGTDCVGACRGQVVSAERFNYVSGMTVREDYEYEGRGGAISKRTTFVNNSEMFATEFAWTDIGNPAFLRYPSRPGSGAPPRNLTYNYELGFLSSIEDRGDEPDPVNTTEVEYQPNGMLLRIAHQNGVNDLWSPDPNSMQRPLQIRSEGTGGGVLFDTGVYKYDGAGNIFETGDDSYDYDLVSRLTGATIETSSGTVTAEYSYDVFGNRNAGYPVDSATNRLEGTDDDPIIYDDHGNLLEIIVGGKKIFDATYDALDKLESGPDRDTYFYVYTADDYRIATNRLVDGQTITTWRVRDLAGKTLREFVEGIGTDLEWNRDYVWREGKLLYSRRAGDGGNLFAHLDHLGTPRLLTNADGGVFSRHDYYPFGVEITDGAEEVVKFTGHERDSQTGLDYMLARDYATSWGRFLQVDPARSSIIEGRPQSWNRYTYTYNNPANLVDPNGEVPVVPALLLAAGILTASAANTPTDVDDPMIPASTFGDQMFSMISTGAGEIGGRIVTRGLGRILGPGLRALRQSRVARSVVRRDGSLRMSKTAARKFNTERTNIPVQSVLETIARGARRPDPQGGKGLFMYTARATSKFASKDKTETLVRERTLEVLVDEKRGTILHVLFPGD